MNTNNLPLVSIIIPTHNRAHLIGKAVTSVLEQTYENIELIIVDDASNDNTDNVIMSFDDKRINYIKLTQKAGASAARNKGILESKGEFISFLDSDDTYEPEKIEKQINAILDAPVGTGAIYCGINLVDYKTKKVIGQKTHRVNFYNNFKHGKFFLTPSTITVLMKRDSLLKIGGFDETLPAHQDTELAIRFCQKYSYILVDEYLVNAVRNHDQISTNSENHIKAKEIIFEKHKNFLSKQIVYSLCKQVAGYYIKLGGFKTARFYVKEAVELKPYKLLTLLQFALITSFPKFLKLLYNFKNN